MLHYTAPETLPCGHSVFKTDFVIHKLCLVPYRRWMSSPLPASWERPAPTTERSMLRRRIESTLATDADLTAFCVDYFPDVHRRFGRDWDRVARVSLLLELADPVTVRAKLDEVIDDRRAGLRTGQDTPWASRSQEHRGLFWGLACAGLASAVALGVFIGGRPRRHDSSTPYSAQPHPQRVTAASEESKTPRPSLVEGPASVIDAAARHRKSAAMPLSKETESAPRLDTNAAVEPAPVGGDSAMPARSEPAGAMPGAGRSTRGTNVINLLQNSPGSTTKTTIIQGR